MVWEAGYSERVRGKLKRQFGNISGRMAAFLNHKQKYGQNLCLQIS